MSKEINFFVLFCSILFFLCLISSQFPFIQEATVKLVEQLKHIDIHDSFWMKQISAFGIMGMLFIITFDLVFFTKMVTNILSHIKTRN